MLSILRRTFFARFARSLLILFGVAGATWSAFSLPQIWLAAPARNVVALILTDDRFKPSVLDNLLSSLDARSLYFSRDDLMRAEALIRLRLAEQTAQGPEEGDRQLAKAYAATKGALSSNPADAFLWLLFYSAENALNGFSEKNLRYLEYSYQVGPREGWIVLRRNRMGLAMFPFLSEHLRNEIVSEFAGMVEADLTDDAAFNLTTVGWPYKDRLLTGLGSAALVSREALARRLATDGIKANVPGVEPNERPW